MDIPCSWRSPGIGPESWTALAAWATYAQLAHAVEAYRPTIGDRSATTLGARRYTFLQIRTAKVALNAL